MPPAAFLALLTIAMLVLAAFRLELDFRRTSKEGAGSEPSTPERRAPAPELRAPPAGGYWQAPFPARLSVKAGQAPRAGFAL